MVLDRERNDAVRPSMRSAICWSAVLTMCVAGTARAQYTPPPSDQPATAQPTAPATAQPTAPATAQPTAPATAQPTAPAPAQPTAPAPAQPTTPATARPRPATSGDVFAPPTASSRWTVESGNTVGANVNVFAGAAGYPGVDLQLIHGLDSSTDVRAHVGINYAFEGITQGTRFEFTAQVGIRKELSSFGPHMKLAGTFDPGILIATSPGQF